MDDRASTKSLPTGVRIRNGSIQIYWERRKEEYAVTLPHPANAEGISAAAKIRSELITKHEWGILTEDDISKAKGLEVDDSSVIVGQGVLFQEVAQKYLKFNDANADSKKGYCRILNRHWMPDLALMPIADITTDDIKNLIADKEFKTTKTLNNCLIPLRGVFDQAVESGVIQQNPMQSVKNKRVQDALPDPFSRAEMNALLKWLDNKLVGDDRFYYWYFELAFWTGCRPSEMIALRWDDVDWFNESIRINKSRVRGVEKPVTKTRVAREVHLNARSKRALEQLKAMGKSRDYVMICPETGEPFFNEKPPRVRLVAAMKACRIRHRPAYNARHTFATMMLMSGVTPMFVAEQMGHSLQMLLKRYAKWIDGDKSKLEIAKLDTE